MSASPKYIVEKILRSHAVHLIAGPSGSNKTTWSFQQLKDNWREDRTILGYNVHPVPYMYISADRSSEETEETLERVGLNLLTFPYLSLTSKLARTNGLRNWKKLLAMVKSEKPDVRLLFVDGFMGLIPGRSDHNTDGGFSHIANFLTDLQGELEDADLTLIAIAHATKMKEDGYYLNPRERILGSAAWAAHCSTIIVLGPTKPGDKDATDERTLVLCPRNAPEQHFSYRLNDRGLLVDTTDELDLVFVEEFLRRTGVGNVFASSDFHDAMSRYMTHRTSERRLQELIPARVTRVCLGRYRVNAAN